MIFRHTRLIMGTALLAVALPAAPALAQDSGDEARIRKLEAEVRALQRKVFPGTDGRFFEPEITGTTPSAPTAASPTSTTAVTDILARLDALEASLARVTGQVESNTNAIAGLTARLDAMGGAAAAPASVPATGAPVGGTIGVIPASGSATPASTVAVPASTTTAATTTTAAPAPRPAASGPSAQRLAAVQAIAKPQTADPGDDEYSYGFRLWEAKFYPEAQQQLAMFVEKYPNHSRTSFGRNLLGRAYLDDGKPREAAPWFLKNYQDDRNGARAPDSLLYLAESMIALGDTNRACIALAEFGETYPAVAAGRLASQYEANRRKVTCN
ncbi:tetratricopeptide repeat protein [Parerythrobacter aurantius]|uniref:tetratricopeptide repeat protein n=1 Tax=Parerythrobacter aurantius TaxID=3127706 RepID=UPI00324F1CFB